jgi:capsular polysaccharide biosynthesis protein
VVRDDAHHTSDELLVVDPPVANWPHPDDLGALVASTTAALGPVAPGPATRVYVTRRGDARTLRGEESLEERLAAAGFAVFTPGAWQDDVALFRRAELIVGPHGAGLANAVFAPEGARVVELSTARFRNPLFRRLAAVRGLAYTHLDLASDPHAPDGDADVAWTALVAAGVV